MASFRIEWQAPEFEYREKSVSWYWLSIIVAVIMLGFAIRQKNFLFGFFVVAAEVLLLVWGHREPRIIQFTVSDTGIAAGEHESHAYDEMLAFSLKNQEEDEWGDLILYFRRRLRPTLHIRVPKSKTEEVGQALRTLLPEREHEETLIDAIEKLLKF